ncbi:tetratricopeptide repeat protein [Tundrisphaera lichenicola]|uniref:tetratricopeptide repeat protein n=1 Tax=Tundrisphaera lichenicola TaxID=2029860 RepID=UPI003EBB1744
MSAGSDPNGRLDKAKAFFGYGNDAAQKGNDVYAAQMYKEACKLAPENLVYRQSLRGVQRRKFGNDPSKVSKLVGVKLQPLRIRIGSAKRSQKWSEMLDHCEDILAQNPWDLTASIDAAEAAENLGLKKIAQYMIEAVLPQGEKDPKFLRSAAHFMEFAEEFQKAIWCWERLKGLVPHDEEARKKVNDLTARAAIRKSGLQESIDKKSGTSLGSSGPEKDLPPDAEELRARMVSPEQRYLQEIEETPERIGPYLALAEHYKLEGRLDDAEKILAKGVKANPEDNYLQGSYAEVQISRIHRAIELTARKVAKEPNDPEPKDKLEQLKVALYKYELKELRRKVSAAPDELKFRMLLGKKLAEGGKHDEAIAEFQQARGSADLKVQALLNAGLSFMANGVPKLAERNFDEALRLADPADTETFNELHYNLGRISEDQGNKAIAEEHYNEVAANDYSYRDVAQRLRKLGEKPPEEE